VLIVIAAFTLHLYVLLDILRAPAPEVRVMPKGLWLVVSLLPLAGPVGWLLAGRPVVGPSSGGGGGGGGGGIAGGPRPGRGPVAPDDDPEFLKRLDEQTWAARMDRLRREREVGRAPIERRDDGPIEGPGDAGPSPVADPPGDSLP
jgi:hypothetical protein